MSRQDGRRPPPPLPPITFKSKSGEERLARTLDYIYNKHATLYRSRFGHPIQMAQRFATEYQVQRFSRRDSRLIERLRNTSLAVRFRSLCRRLGVRRWLSRS